ncbi:unnamed protein product, partial [Prorocentrum cordatum]
MRLTFNLAAAAGTNLIMIMIVLKSAFNKVATNLAYDTQMSTDDIDNLICHMDIPQCMQPAIQTLINNNGIVSTHIDNKHMLSMLTEAHRNTWFFTERDSEYAAPRLGTRPGVSIADFTFNALMSAVTKDYHEEAIKADATVRISDSPPASCTNPEVQHMTTTSFVDDVKAMATVTDGNAIETTASRHSNKDYDRQGCERLYGLDYDIENNGRWSTTVADDLHHTKTYTSKHHNTPSHDDIRQWIGMAKEELSNFKSITTHAYRTAIEFNKEKAATVAWRRRINDMCDGTTIPTPDSEAPQHDCKYLCYECGQILNGKAAYQKHMRAKHSQQEHIINYIHGTTCQACVREYWTVNRLHKHMCASRQCASLAMKFSKRLDDDAANDIPEEM